MSDLSYIQKYFYFLQLKKGNPERARKANPSCSGDLSEHPHCFIYLLFESSQMTNLLFKLVCWLNEQGINTY